MAGFELNKKFFDYDSVLHAKKAYEIATNTLLTVVLVVKDNALVVKTSMLNHTNHATDETTYKHYPENMRIEPQQLQFVEKMITLGVNKRKLKLDLMAGGDKVVPLKVLHNIQTKINLNRDKNYDGAGDAMQQLIQRLQEAPDARVQVIADDNDELIVVFYQEDRMAAMFEKYPELILFDGTYKLNNLNMPLILQLCVDGNGETEIASIFFDRDVYTQKFPDAVRHSHYIL